MYESLESDRRSRLEAEEVRVAARRARWHFTIYPLAGLAVLLLLGVPPALLRLFNYGTTMPLFLFLGGIVVIFYGAWYDFGAREVVGNLIQHQLPFGPADLDYIYRQQFWLTLIYLGVGGLYMTTALVMFVLAGGIL
jgi:hypothetical protein